MRRLRCSGNKQYDPFFIHFLILFSATIFGTQYLGRLELLGENCHQAFLGTGNSLISLCKTPLFYFR